MTRNEIKRRFPNASADFIKANTISSIAGPWPAPIVECIARNESLAKDKEIDKDCLGDNVSEMPIPYTQEEDAAILNFYRERSGLPVDLNELSKQLGRSMWSVAMRASRLAVTESNRPKTVSHKMKCSASQRSRVRTKEETASASNRQKKYISTHGHPKGFKGHKRTPEELEILREASQKAWADPNHKVNSAPFRQSLSDRASKAAALRPAKNAFSRSRHGKRKDLGNVFFRSAWEANYARYLNFLKAAEGKIFQWQYEPETFWFESIKRGCRSYKPDFKVSLTNGETEYHEVKGWLYPRAKTALKRMKKYHPSVKVVLIDQSRYKAIARQVGKIIKGWE